MQLFFVSAFSPSDLFKLQIPAKSRSRKALATTWGPEDSKRTIPNDGKGSGYSAKAKGKGKRYYKRRAPRDGKSTHIDQQQQQLDK